MKLFAAYLRSSLMKKKEKKKKKNPTEKAAQSSWNKAAPNLLKETLQMKLYWY